MKRRTAAAAAPAVDHGAIGPAMLARPSRMAETIVAGILRREVADNHLIDRLEHAAQISARQYEAAQKLLEMCGDAGLLPVGAAQLGRIGRGGELPDDMDEARVRFRRLLVWLGAKRAELVMDLMHERHPGTWQLATLQSALEMCADRWKMAGEG